MQALLGDSAAACKLAAQDTLQDLGLAGQQRNMRRVPVLLSYNH